MKWLNIDGAARLEQHDSSRLERALIWTVRITALLYAVALAYEPLYHLFRNSLLYLDFPEDDFFYYLVIAKNLALHGISSFDGIVPTNGYHPLWLWTLTGIVYALGGAGEKFFIVLELVQVLAAVASAELVMRLVKELFPGVRFRFAVALFVISLQTILIFLSMETVLAIPCELLFGLFVVRMLREDSSSRQAFVCGIAGSLLVLARLDSVIAIVLAGGFLLVMSRDVKKIACFAIGLLPVALYLLSNKLFFGSWLTVSSEAKLLKDGWAIDPTILFLIRTPRGSLYLLLIFIGTSISLRRAIRRVAEHRSREFGILVLLLFPVLYTLILSLRSSWALYPWYLYPYPVAIGIGTLVIAKNLPRLVSVSVERLSVPLTALAVLGISVFLVGDIPAFTTHLSAYPDTIYEHALRLADFAHSHPGRYAMGDRAGLSAYLMDRPVLQMEGLAADQALVDSIKVQADLLDVLKRYKVQYYVVSELRHDVPQQNGVWLPVEPKAEQSGVESRKMRGHFYAPDVFDILPPRPEREAAQKPPQICYTRVLDISRAVEASPVTP